MHKIPVIAFLASFVCALNNLITGISFRRTHDQPLDMTCEENSSMNDAPSNLEQEVAHLIVDTLHLEEVTPEQIEPEAPLFGEGLGLDSLDMLELSMAVEQKYGVALRSDDPEHTKVFTSLRILSAYIQLHRVG